MKLYNYFLISESDQEIEKRKEDIQKEIDAASVHKSPENDKKVLELKNELQNLNDGQMGGY